MSPDGAGYRGGVSSPIAVARRALLLSATAVAAVGLTVLPAASASAHDDLVSSNPAADSSIADDPGVVTLAFSETLLAVGESTDGFAVQVVDPEGLHYESGCLALDGAQVTSPIALGDAGGYVVLWQVVSSDGHPTSGQFEFDYEPQSLANAADGLTQAPVCGGPWSGAPDGSPTPTPTAAEPTPTATDDSSVATTAPSTAAATDPGADSGDPAAASAPLPWYAIVLIAVAAAGALAVILVIAVRRGRGGGFGGQ